MSRYYDKSRKRLFELPEFKFTGDLTGSKYFNQPGYELTIDCSKFDISYIKDMMDEMYSLSGSIKLYKKDYMREIFISNENSLIHFIGCTLKTIEYDNNMNFNKLEFSVDHNEILENNSEFEYEIIQEMRKIKLDKLLD